MRKRFAYATKIGKIYITEESSSIVSISFNRINEPVLEEETLLLREASVQIDEYLAGKRKKFALPLKVHGTRFQERVWNELLNIPYGETRSYLDVAKAINSPNGSRAVGMANAKNPIIICIPCHRVICSDQKLGGYSAGGEKVKRYLLNLENLYK